MLYNIYNHGLKTFDLSCNCRKKNRGRKHRNRKRKRHRYSGAGNGTLEAQVSLKKWVPACISLETRTTTTQMAFFPNIKCRLKCFFKTSSHNMCLQKVILCHAKAQNVAHSQHVQWTPCRTGAYACSLESENWQEVSSEVVGCLWPQEDPASLPKGNACCED